MEQLLLVTSCDSLAGIGASFRTHARINGWTDRRDVGNSVLDLLAKSIFCFFSENFEKLATEDI